MSDLGPPRLANDFLTALCESAGVDPGRCRRLIVDAEAGRPIKLWFECFGGDELLELIPPDLTKARVRVYVTDGNGEHVDVTTAGNEW